MKTEKRCTACKEIKLAAEFHIGGRKDGARFLQSRCKSCSVVYMVEWRKNQTQSQRDAKIERDRWVGREKKYGITKDAYDLMFAAQSGLCAICQRPERSMGHGKTKIRELSVDHDHGTDAIRGLLCHSCNVAIGLLNEDCDVLSRAAYYLAKYIAKAVA